MTTSNPLRNSELSILMSPYDPLEVSVGDVDLTSSAQQLLDLHWKIRGIFEMIVKEEKYQEYKKLLHYLRCYWGFNMIVHEHENVPQLASVLNILSTCRLSYLFAFSGDDVYRQECHPTKRGIISTFTFTFTYLNLDFSISYWIFFLIHFDLLPHRNGSDLRFLQIK